MDIFGREAISEVNVATKICHVRAATEHSSSVVRTETRSCGVRSEENSFKDTHGNSMDANKT